MKKRATRAEEAQTIANLQGVSRFPKGVPVDAAGNVLEDVEIPIEDVDAMHGALDLGSAKANEDIERIEKQMRTGEKVIWGAATNTTKFDLSVKRYGHVTVVVKKLTPAIDEMGRIPQALLSYNECLEHLRTNYWDGQQTSYQLTLHQPGGFIITTLTVHFDFNQAARHAYLQKMQQFPVNAGPTPTAPIVTSALPFQPQPSFVPPQPQVHPPPPLPQGADMSALLQHVIAQNEYWMQRAQNPTAPAPAPPVMQPIVQVPYQPPPPSSAAPSPPERFEGDGYVREGEQPPANCFLVRGVPAPKGYVAYAKLPHEIVRRLEVAETPPLQPVYQTPPQHFANPIPQQIQMPPPAPPVPSQVERVQETTQFIRNLTNSSRELRQAIGEMDLGTPPSDPAEAGEEDVIKVTDKLKLVKDPLTGKLAPWTDQAVANIPGIMEGVGSLIEKTGAENQRKIDAAKAALEIEERAMALRIQDEQRALLQAQKARTIAETEAFRRQAMQVVQSAPMPQQAPQPAPQYVPPPIEEAPTFIEEAPPPVKKRSMLDAVHASQRRTNAMVNGKS